jgi:lytic murein transglycosylase
MRGDTLRAFLFAVAMAAILGLAPAHAQDCGKNAEGFSAWLKGFKQVAALDGVSAEVIDTVLGNVSYDASVKAHDHGVAAFGHDFASFAASHATPAMVARGKAMLRTYAGPLARIEQRFGVPGPILVAIWGEETSFGGDNGNFPTFNALATLAYDCRRPDRFRAELIDALMLVQRSAVQNPRALRGAWAGEIGQTQLMPSAVLMFATTPDGDGVPDIIHNSPDALASTANFLKGHGWQSGAGWDEGEPNFAAILEWNGAQIYAKTLALFADKLAGR